MLLPGVYDCLAACLCLDFSVGSNSILCGHSIPANFLTAHLLMPEPSLAVFVVRSTRILPDFPYNERSKMNGCHFTFRIFSFTFAFNQQVKRQRIQNQNLINQKSNATPYGRLSNTKNVLNKDGAGGRTAVTEWNEFAVLALFWFLFWGNAKKGTKTRSND
ncbi:MAG: hypothetical protein H6562_12030 [Lewinellaceae bacterium]|nr:hypothetical protein [Lewinellaceae bacterium]